MATYVYETIPGKAGAKAKQFEIQQSMKDAPLTRHPETGEPVRRVITGGYGFIGSERPKTPAAPSAHSCGSGCGCSRN